MGRFLPPDCRLGQLKMLHAWTLHARVWGSLLGAEGELGAQTYAYGQGASQRPFGQPASFEAPPDKKPCSDITRELLPGPVLAHLWNSKMGHGSSHCVPHDQRLRSKVATLALLVHCCFGVLRVVSAWHDVPKRVTPFGAHHLTSFSCDLLEVGARIVEVELA